MNRAYRSYIKPIIIYSLQRTAEKEIAYPPCNQIIHGSSLVPLDWVRDPLVFSKPQKNSVSFGCPALLTGMFPAKLRVSGGEVNADEEGPKVMLGRGRVTS